MAQFDVYLNPDPVQRERTPYLLDVQNSFLERLATRVVVPLRGGAHTPLPMMFSDVSLRGFLYVE